jgi:hypothetical protein
LDSLEPALQRLSLATDALPALAEDLEGRFLNLATAVEELPGVSAALVRHSQQLVALATGQNSGGSVYQATYDGLALRVGFVDRHWETIRGLREQLHHSLPAIDAMLRQESDLGQTVAPLKYIQTLFKVESAGLDSSLQSMFLALTEEISGLQSKVSETFGEKFQVLRDMRRVVANVVRDLERQDRELGRFLGERKQALEKTLGGLQADLEQNRRREVKLTQVSQCIAEKVGGLVLGLQAQDIVAQKLAHVRAACGQMGERYAGRRSLDTAGQSGLLRFLVQTATVEQAQLLSIQEDLRQTEEQLSGAITAIDDEVRRLDADCISLNEFDSVTVGYNALIETLLEALGGVHEMVETTVTSTARAQAEIQPLGGRTSNVTATMRELSAHIRVIALNAQVQAARIECGTGLEVLAAATNRVAVETAGISEAIATQLDQFAVTMDGLVRSIVALHAEGAAQQRSWHERNETERGALHAVRDAALRELQETAGCADRVRALIGAMRDKISLGALAEQPLAGPLEPLQAVAQHAGELRQLPEFTGLTDVSATEPDLGAYTMESERKVHQAALAAAGRNHTAPDARLGRSPGDDSSSGSALTGLATSGARQGEDQAAGAGNETRKEFGDNVDLF